MSKPVLLLCVLSLTLTFLAAFSTRQWWLLSLNSAAWLLANGADDEDDDDTPDPALED